MTGKLAIVLLLALASPALAIDAHAPESCATGPVIKTYGGTKWLVASCSDGKSLVFVADEKSPAAPFEFDLTYTGDGYDLDGHGKGNRAAADAAYADLREITAADVLSLIKETQGAPKPKN